MSMSSRRKSHTTDTRLFIGNLQRKAICHSSDAQFQEGFIGQAAKLWCKQTRLYVTKPTRLCLGTCSSAADASAVLPRSALPSLTEAGPYFTTSACAPISSMAKREAPGAPMDNGCISKGSQAHAFWSRLPLLHKLCAVHTRLSSHHPIPLISIALILWAPLQSCLAVAPAETHSCSPQEHFTKSPLFEQSHEF
ncbi:hypothetical protein Anapl_11135 [Anas platyrhynchos]|uniref:Uncharacterized protein n=1 Tax=Anas platyrhynchos TaxID=8839 RepID=R0L5E3_ANAPL|nr:hypothetical protein Anapl_11135 [Anas platyrhynchos]